MADKVARGVGFALEYKAVELRRDKSIREIISRLKTAKGNEGAVKVEGTWGSFAPLLAAYISKELGRPILYIRPHIDDADKAADDLHTFGAEQIETLPAWEGEEELADATDEIRTERLKLVSRVSALVARKNKGQLIIPTSIQAICQPIPKPQAMEKSCLQLQIDKIVPLEQVVEWLVGNGFEGVERVDLPGQFARRGGIVDIYAPLLDSRLRGNDKESDCAQAIRVEFFGDTIESIREINLDTQRSSQQIKEVNILSAVCGAAVEERELFVNILPQDTIIILEEPNDIEEVANVFRQRAEKAERLYDWQDIYKAITKFTQLHICRFATATQDEFLKVDIKSVQRFQHRAASLWAGHKEALQELVSEAKEGKKVCLYCESSAENKRITEIITEGGESVPANFKLLQGFVHQGFVINFLNTIIISHHELFGQYALRRRPRMVQAGAPVDTLADLQAGDYVVHASYGIGKFLGAKTIQEKGGTSEYLTIEYADGAKVQVSVRNIALVQKFIGTTPKRPKLSKIGSKRWQRQKEKVARSVQDLAGELLEVQAQRQAKGGIAFGADSAWQAEFEESFPYQETPDQTVASEQIKADMREPVAMDRLLCGDVGYGKTELAMRAAFKAVENGKQAAVLVPTTVLCVQHGRTFTERFADFPISVEVLNRFKTTKQVKDIISRTKRGRVDVLIGTHRLLSKDVGFKDLGLLIIDEEQRFGVTDKEKLKRLRFDVDVLTMTATPIPRTLHLSLLGLRDISSLTTPPLDRRSIVTTVTAYNDELIKKAIFRELNRQGQVFFLHNRVKTIEKKAWEIQKLIGDAKVAIAHGQMAKSELEKAMIDFVLGKTDVLVCTTIIESGLDIPNANTIFINDADRFGLAELHQLRGRVGRYKHRAFAYMLLPASRPITPTAAKRLKAIEDYSHLGAGFRIALRDLEIRGAGNILGAEQSGHIQMVGYQMYCDLLADTVRKLKNEPAEAEPAAVIDLGLTSYIPKSYIPSDRYRMDIYRRIAVTKTTEDLKQMASELADVYGPVPDEVELLLELTGIRIDAGKRSIKSIVASGKDLIFSFSKDSNLQANSLFAGVKGTIRTADPKTVYLRLPQNYFEQKTLMNVLRKILSTNS
ncbi:MAG: transcription-repair coupling factor [Phycisphaerae bacterium]|nr:transcription-repair coupling factor [Phycisphaerae bacterium]MDD5380557.1 transcription-repair coupling factor [Phycisphaerae bacterium]